MAPLIAVALADLLAQAPVSQRSRHGAPKNKLVPSAPQSVR